MPSNNGRNVENRAVVNARLRLMASDMDEIELEDRLRAQGVTPVPRGEHGTFFAPEPPAHLVPPDSQDPRHDAMQLMNTRSSEGITSPQHSEAQMSSQPSLVDDNPDFNRMMMRMIFSSMTPAERQEMQALQARAQVSQVQQQDDDVVMTEEPANAPTPTLLGNRLQIPGNNADAKPLQPGLDSVSYKPVPNTKKEAKPAFANKDAEITISSQKLQDQEVAVMNRGDLLSMIQTPNVGKKDKNITMPLLTEKYGKNTTTTRAAKEDSETSPTSTSARNPTPRGYPYGRPSARAVMPGHSRGSMYFDDYLALPPPLKKVGSALREVMGAEDETPPQEGADHFSQRANVQQPLAGTATTATTTVDNKFLLPAAKYELGATKTDSNLLLPATSYVPSTSNSDSTEKPCKKEIPVSETSNKTPSKHAKTTAGTTDAPRWLVPTPVKTREVEEELLQRTPGLRDGDVLARKRALNEGRLQASLPLNIRTPAGLIPGYPVVEPQLRLQPHEAVRPGPDPRFPNLREVIAEMTAKNKAEKAAAESTATKNANTRRDVNEVLKNGPTGSSQPNVKENCTGQMEDEKKRNGPVPLGRFAAPRPESVAYSAPSTHAQAQAKSRLRERRQRQAQQGSASTNQSGISSAHGNSETGNGVDNGTDAADDPASDPLYEPGAYVAVPDGDTRYFLVPETHIFALANMHAVERERDTFQAALRDARSQAAAAALAYSELEESKARLRTNLNAQIDELMSIKQDLARKLTFAVMDRGAVERLNARLVLRELVEMEREKLAGKGPEGKDEKAAGYASAGVKGGAKQQESAMDIDMNGDAEDNRNKRTPEATCSLLFDAGFNHDELAILDKALGHEVVNKLQARSRKLQ